MVGLFGFNKNVGFFEDKYIVFEGIFFRGDSPESGGRIMVGEFLKDWFGNKKTAKHLNCLAPDGTFFAARADY